MNTPQTDSDLRPYTFLPQRMLARELEMHLSDAAVADVVDWERLCLVANDMGYDLDIELMMVKSGPTPRANLRRLALSIAA